MAVSIPDSRFDKMTNQLPADKDSLLIFYCGGLNCRLSHDSARKAEALGYRNIKVFAEGFPGWMKVTGNYAAVTPEWLKSQLDGNADMLLVDSRPKRAKYDKGHIPSAVSIPDMQFEELKDQLPADKEKMLVFYCEGFKCKLSHESARKAMALGHRNVKVMGAGYPGWKELAGSPPAAKAEKAAELKAGKQEGSIDHELFKKLMAQNPESIYLVDVRDSTEFKNGTLKTAVNIPVEQLEEKIKALPADKPIVFICGTGARSGESYYMVQDIRPELKNVYYLDGELTIHKDGTFSLKESV
jgi:rhodanese-related sulfurtransferase